jgi:tRNA threonylcarbamoyladenosine biosynthesis protein TsaE
VLLRAGLGAGKTTLTKGIARGLGISETVTSPTYTIISEYAGKLPLRHIDLYRIDDSEELENLGLREILGGDGVAVVEWSEKLPDAFLYDAVRVEIHGEGGGDRVFEITLPEGEELL